MGNERLDGEWLLDISIPERYPYIPPEIRFITPICHPNVHFKVSLFGRVSVD